MKKISRFPVYIHIILYALLVAAAAVLIFWLVRTAKDTEVGIGSDGIIAVTPEKIAEINRIGKWEFLSVVDEQVVDTVRHNRLMADDRLTCIYYGTVRVGIDLTNAPDSWVSNHGDTITVTLPQPRILDKQFIDEARTKVFYERGRWTAPAKEQMYRRARRAMAARALTPENIATVRQKAADRFRALFLNLGAKEVIINFDDASDPWQF